MPEDVMTRSAEGRVSPKLGPIVMLSSSVLSIAAVLLPWAKLQVSDPALEVRSGWYSGFQLMFPMILIVLMLVPVVMSVLMLAGKGTGRRALEVGFCSFALGMELMLLGVLFALALTLADLANKVDLFEIGLGAGFWIALLLLAANVAALVLTSYGAPGPARRSGGEGA